MLAGIVAKLLQIFDVAVEGRFLTISGSVAIVRQEPSQWHVVVHVTVDGCSGRELIVVLLAIERFLDACLVAGTLLVALAVLEGHDAALVCLFPVVTVVGIEVTFVETELRQQYRVARQLIVFAQQVGRLFAHHEEYVEVLRLMG